MPQIQDNWDQLLIPVVSHFFDLGEKSVPTIRQALFGADIPSSLAEEKGTGIGSMGSEAWDGFGNTGDVGELDFDQGFTKTYVNTEYPVNFTIRKQLIINDQYGVMQRNARRIGVSAGIKMERDAVSILNGAFTASAPFLGGDGVALCSASHKPSPANATPVQNNTGTSALTKTAVSATRTTMMEFADDKGDIVGVVPNELWVPPALQDKAIEIVGSQLDPDSGNNAVNPQNQPGRWTIRVAQRLTAAKAWFMVDSVQRQELVNWFIREAFQIRVIYEDTIWIKFQAKMHYSFGFDDWRWIFGQNPA